MRAGVLVMLGAAVLALAPAVAARPPLQDRPEDGSSRSCNAGTLTLRDGKPLKLVVFDQLSAITHARRYRDNSVLWNSVRKVSLRIDGADLHQLWAVKGQRRIIYTPIQTVLDAFGQSSPPASSRPDAPARDRGRAAGGQRAWNKTGGPSVLGGGGGVKRATRSRRRSCHA